MSTFITFALSLTACLALTPLVIWVATRIDLVDRPDPQRKLHGRAIPLGGGVAVFLATSLAVAVIFILPELNLLELPEVASLHERTEAWACVLGLLPSALILLLVGLADDLHGLRGRQKLFGQMLAAAVVLYSGLMIQEVRVLDWTVHLGTLAIPFTLFWLLGAINALNLLDGADGFASTIGIVISGSLAALAAMNGHTTEALIAVALTGALVGFMFFNFPPAKIFLGDAGSMLIGLVIGVLAIRTSLKGPATVALAAPMAVLAIPIFDSFIAILRRWLTGRSIYETDRGHLHHSLARRGFGPKAMLAGIALLCVGTAGGGLLSVAMQNESAAWISAGSVLGVLVISKVFGFTELAMATQRAFAFGNSLIVSNTSPGGRIRQESVRLQGSRKWDELWSTLTDFAEQHDLSRVRLDLNMAWLHEGYHAVWQRENDLKSDELWQARLPLRVHDRSVGRLELTGIANNGTSHQLLALVSELVDSLQPCVTELCEDVHFLEPTTPKTASEVPKSPPLRIHELRISDTTRESV